MITFILSSLLGIIPAPKEEILGEGFFESPKVWSYVISSSTGAPVLEQYLSESTFEVVFKSATEKPILTISAGPGTDDRYELTVSKNGVSIISNSEIGAFYGLQSLIQMTMLGEKIPCCHIIDEPVLPYRGLMIDVSRHFRSVEFIKRQIDMLALLKMNKLHFHLVDAVGWRIQLDSHPELVEKTSFRAQLEYKTKVDFLDIPSGYQPGSVYDQPGCYGGYYTKVQLKEIVEYARVRHIDVIPEIEMPGHSGELRITHPEIFCEGTSLRPNSICPGNEAALKFFEEILSEIFSIFPSEFIHIGGDEAEKDDWKVCPRCREEILKNNLKGVEELQNHFMSKIDRFVSDHGRRMIGWDEIRGGSYSKGATIMSWRKPEYGLEAMKDGYDVIMTPTDYFYFCYYQSAPEYEPRDLGGYVPLSKTYSFPLPDSPHMLGVQGNLWSEFIITDENYEYMAYPRIFAVSELGWSVAERRNDFDEFKGRCLRLCDAIRRFGYCPFDLRNEIPIDPHFTTEKFNTVALGAKYTTTGLCDGLTDESVRGKLTDGSYVGVTRFSGKGSVTIDLGKSMKISSVCPCFLRHMVDRESCFPCEMKVYVSKNGNDYECVGRNRSQIDDSSLVWGLIQLPVFFKTRKARFVKVEFNPSTTCNEYTYIRENFIDRSSHKGSRRWLQAGIQNDAPCNGVALTEIIIN